MKTLKGGEQYLIDLKFKGIDSAQGKEGIAERLLSECLVVQANAQSVPCGKLTEVVADAFGSYDSMGRKSRDKNSRLMIKCRNVIGISAADT